MKLTLAIVVLAIVACMFADDNFVPCGTDTECETLFSQSQPE